MNLATWKIPIVAVFASIVSCVTLLTLQGLEPPQAVAEEPTSQPIVLLCADPNDGCHDIPIGPTRHGATWGDTQPWWASYQPSKAWFDGIMQLETGGDPNARQENPYQITEAFWNEGVAHARTEYLSRAPNWDYLVNRHNIAMSQEVIANYLLKYRVDNDCAAAMIFRRGPTGSGWKYWKALEPKLADQELE